MKISSELATFNSTAYVGAVYCYHTQHTVVVKGTKNKRNNDIMIFIEKYYYNYLIIKFCMRI